ncbi:dihydrodipicolinate reductase [Anopheles sinensis]|uniref:Dihydrodipicolinate reductase n=1 Tax=Anopheles sinensis TaxID=74873 RepID=A0A084WL28_ANOSI|nr:dihydrodipicolinate reductase [Anopheles sinensis]
MLLSSPEAGVRVLLALKSPASKLATRAWKGCSAHPDAVTKQPTRALSAFGGETRDLRTRWRRPHHPTASADTVRRRASPFHTPRSFHVSLLPADPSESLRQAGFRYRTYEIESEFLL